MSKAYIVTAVDYGDSADGKARTIGVFFDKKKAEEELAKDMDTYKEFRKTERRDIIERHWAIWHDDHHGCEWNIEDKEVEIPLTSLQTTTLNGIGMDIQKGEEGWYDVRDSLSDEEAAYLRDWLKREGIEVPADDGEEGK